MGICAAELREFVIRPTLQRLNDWSPVWENLLLGTIAQHSQFGFHVKDGRGMGIYQIDKETHRYVWDKYLAFDPDRASLIRGFASQREFLQEPDTELVSNLAYATAIAWAIYKSNQVKLPTDADNIQAIAECWFRFFPRRNITQTPTDFERNYEKHVEPHKSISEAVPSCRSIAAA